MHKLRETFNSNLVAEELVSNTNVAQKNSGDNDISPANIPTAAFNSKQQSQVREIELPIRTKEFRLKPVYGSEYAHLKKARMVSADAHQSRGNRAPS